MMTRWVVLASCVMAIGLAGCSSRPGSVSPETSTVVLDEEMGEKEAKELPELRQNTIARPSVSDGEPAKTRNPVARSVNDSDPPELPPPDKKLPPALD